MSSSAKQGGRHVLPNPEILNQVAQEVRSYYDGRGVGLEKTVRKIVQITQKPLVSAEEARRMSSSTVPIDDLVDAHVQVILAHIYYYASYRNQAVSWALTSPELEQEHIDCMKRYLHFELGFDVDYFPETKSLVVSWG